MMTSRTERRQKQVSLFDGAGSIKSHAALCETNSLAPDVEITAKSELAELSDRRNTLTIPVLIDSLCEIISRANREYYLSDRPTISDADYDRLFRELESLERDYPEYHRIDSPTKLVGAPPDTLPDTLPDRQSENSPFNSVLPPFAAVKHRFPMLSLANALDENEFLDFVSRCQKGLLLDPSAALEMTAEYKFDGLAVELVYQDSKLVSASTRGDGEIGENVTNNIRAISEIPSVLRPLADIPSVLEVRGEVYMTIPALEKLNARRSERGEQPFANPRNAAVGSLRQLDPAVTAERELSFSAYGLSSPEPLPISTLEEERALLRSLGLPVQQDVSVLTSADAVLQYYKVVIAQRDALAFEIDGIVVKLNSYLHHKTLGVRSRSPRWAIALKFPPREEHTKLLNISVQVGRTGVLTPVAELAPISVSGVIVKRATLHNQDEIDRKDIRVGDTVIVRRQGDVIPAVIGVVPGLRDGSETPFRMPLECPACGSIVKRLEETDVAFRCTNIKCPAKLLNRLRHFVSRPAFDIESLGEKLLEQLVDVGLISSPGDIFALKSEDLRDLARQGDKSVANLIEAISRARTISLSRFIYSLGIRHVGEKTSKVLAQKFGSLELLMQAKLSELEQLNDIGPKVANSIVTFFQDPEELELIESLLRNGVIIEQPPRIAAAHTNSLWSGKTVVLTGSLQGLSREQATSEIELLGGKVSSSVSKRTDLLVAGAEAGSKLKKAEQLGIEIIDEQEFLNRLASGRGQ